MMSSGLIQQMSCCSMISLATGVRSPSKSVLFPTSLKPLPVE